MDGLAGLRTTGPVADRVTRGRDLLRDGHVDRITVTAGRVTAAVHGSRTRPRPHLATVRVPVLTEDEWDVLLEAATEEPALIAALLDKDVPPELARTAEAVGVPLLPPEPRDITAECSCTDPVWLCEHAVALWCGAARYVGTDPYLLLLVRGRGQDELLTDLARRNARHVARAVSRAADGSAAGSPSSELSVANSPADDGSSAAKRERAPRVDSFLAEPVARGAEPGGARTVPDAGPAAPTVSVAPVTYAPAVGAPGTDAGPLARAALATRVRPPLPAPLPLPSTPGAPPVFPEHAQHAGHADRFAPHHAEDSPDPHGDPDDLPDADALTFLATDATRRAHACLAASDDGAQHPPAGPLFGPSDPWHDAVRLAATHPELGARRTFSPAAAALARATGHTPLGLARAAAAWRQGGAAGLDVLETPWDPPAGDFDRARAALAREGLRVTIRHNRLTSEEAGLQLRYGRDGHWYPYRRATPPDAPHTDPAADDPWWPEGPSQPDPVTAARPA
nr:hypothetical protein [Streptomyces sp. HNM0574]